MTAKALVIGARGYVGNAILDLYRGAGVEVVGTSRQGGADETVANGAELDRLLDGEDFDQVVLTAQLTAADVDWLIDRVDGPRWAVLSSAQLASLVPAPRTEFALAREHTALARGATVFRSTMIFGRAGDLNISRLVRSLQRWRVTVQVGDGSQLVQPVHVADLVSLLDRHRRKPLAGIFGVGGDQQVPTCELVGMVRELLAVRLPVVAMSPSLVRLVSRVGVPGARPDQLRRLEEDKTVDITKTCETFEWTPQPLAHRLQQAVWEVIRGS